MTIWIGELASGAEIVTRERCANCERWLRAKDARRVSGQSRQGSCGKDGSRTDQQTWCRFYLPAEDR